MKKIKEERNITIYVNITYKLEDCLIQTFSFTCKRKQDLSYLYDCRFLIKNELEKIIKENLEEGFITRIDCEDKVIIKYNSSNIPSPKIKVINSYIPPFLGCEYCSKAEIKDGFVYCAEKNKHYTKSNGIKRCPIFRIKEKILT